MLAAISGRTGQFVLISESSAVIESVKRWIELSPNFEEYNLRFALFMMLSLALIFSPGAMPSCIAVDMPSSSIADSNFSARYTILTKQILFAGIELERISLDYRLQSSKPRTIRALRYFLFQEGAAGCLLGFEVGGMKQFRTGRKRPLKVSLPALKGAFETGLVGSVIGGSGSLLELSINGAQAIDARLKGLDTNSCVRKVAEKLTSLDKLLGERDALVDAHKDSAGYERACAEGRVFKAMRNVFVEEFATFAADTNSYHVFQNAFLFFNACYNTVGATAAGVGIKAVGEPKLTGPANILFVITGATAAVSPVLASALGALDRKLTMASVKRKLNCEASLNEDALAKNLKEMEALKSDSGQLMPTFPAAERVAIYTQSEKLFSRQLKSEVTTMRDLNQIALQTSLLGPAIGGLIMTQGILGTTGYYRYTFRPRKQFNLDYAGAIVGTVAVSSEIVGNAAWVLGRLSYENKLRKQHRMPNQLIEARLQHLNELEEQVRAL